MWAHSIASRIVPALLLVGMFPISAHGLSSGAEGKAVQNGPMTAGPVLKSDAKLRVIVSTDIGGSDPDDFQSMVHYLMYADQFDTEGLISSPPGAGRKEHILETLDAYATDYPKLVSQSADYPTPDTLRALAKQGATAASPSAGYGTATEGSNWIVNCADSADSRPLWILVWGAITDVAQAVHDAPRIKSKVRVYFIGSWNTSQDRNARDYLYNSHSDLWWIECNSTFRGMYVGGNQSGDLENSAFVAQHVRDHGALGNFLYNKKTAIKMGDTPSVLYLLYGSPDQPAAQHWGGMFRTTGHGAHYWTDLTDAQYREGSYDGAKTVNVWRESYLRDWQARMDRAAGEVNLVNNHSFEVDPLPSSWPYYTTSITGWNAVAGSLLNDAGGPFYTTALGSIPHGSKVYGKQGAGTLSQDISGLYHGRSFRLVFHVNSRYAHPPMDITATLGSQTLCGPTTIPVNSGAFHQLSAGPFQYDSAWGSTLTFHFTNPQGDSTLLLDNVQLLSPQAHTVAYQSDPVAGGVVSGPGNIAAIGSPGDSISIVATPGPGFLLNDVAASSGTVVHVAGGEYALSGVTADTTVTASFSEVGGIVINGNRSATNNPAVTLALTWGNAVRMRFSDDGAHWSAWEPLAATRLHSLPTGPDGHRTVRVQFLGVSNSRSAAYSDFIRLDTTPPTGTILVNDGAMTTTTPEVTLALTWTDAGSGVSRMRFSDDGAHWTFWEPAASTRFHALPAVPGYQTVRVQYLDGAGNRSAACNDYIKLL